MELLCLCVGLLSVLGVESRLAVVDDVKSDIQNVINTTNIKRAIIDDTQNEIEHKINYSANEVDHKTNVSANEVEHKTNDIANEIEHKTNDIANEIEHKTNNSANEVEHKTNNSANEVEHKTNNSANEVEHKTNDSAIEVEHKNNNSANEVDHKTNNKTKEMFDFFVHVVPAKNTTRMKNTDVNIPEGLMSSFFNFIHSQTNNGTALLLTPLLEKGNQVEARSKSKVNPEHFLGIESYSGFFTVNKTYNSNLFFWYFPALGRPVNETPWMVWLQGGPGASSMAGLFEEVGPFRVFNNSLRGNPYTWLKEHSMVFIDNPVGTGFSFTDSPKGYAQNMETYSSHLLSTITQFLQVFPELRTAPLYVAGESYAGKYVPALGMALHKQKQAGNMDINLQGFLIGNAFVDPEVISDPSTPMLYFGILQEQQIDIIKPILDDFKQYIHDNNTIGAKVTWVELINVLLTITNQKHNYNFLRDDVALGSFVNFLKKSEIKKALHVGDINYNMVNFTVNMALTPDFLWNSRPFFEELLEYYRVLAYCGQLDLMLPCVHSSRNHAKWNWSQAAEFRKSTRYPYMFRGKLAGYHRSGGNFTEVIIRGAGHMAPQDAPAVTFDMVSRFTSHRPYSKVPTTEGRYIQMLMYSLSSINSTYEMMKKDILYM